MMNKSLLLALLILVLTVILAACGPTRGGEVMPIKFEHTYLGVISTPALSLAAPLADHSGLGLFTLWATNPL
jgi:hypothetical protein